VIDDGTIFHLREGEYRLCSQERHMAWFQAAAIGMDVSIVDETHDIIGMDVSIVDETHDIAALAIQGPTSFSILQKMNLDGLENLKMFGLTHFDFEGTELMVSRTGFTGDLGYEVWLSPDKAEAFWDALFAAGKFHGIRAMGTDALEQSRIEAGYIAAYIDFLPAKFELGLDWLVDFKKPNFNGRRALAKEKREGSTWRLVKLDIEGNKPAHHSYIYAKSGGRKKEVGFITTAAWSPVCKQNIAIGTVRTPHGKVGDKLLVEVFYQREMHWSRLMAEATVVDKPFWDPPRRRATPPGPY